MEQTATKEPQEETFATAAQTPERPDRPENDIAVVPPPPGSDTALAEVGASTITVDDTPEAPADERFRPESTIEDTLPSTIENSERDTVDRPTPTTQVRAQEQQASLEDPDDLRFATATPESTGFPLETAANNEATATAIPDESNRSADQALSAPAPDLPEVTQTGVLPPTPRPVSTPVKPIKSETAATGAQEQLTDRPAALERTDRPAPAKSAANPPERPRPESVPPTPEPKQPAAPKKVARKPLVAATTAKAPLKDDALKSPTTAEKLQDFLKTYCRLYSSKDVDRFAALFTPDAIERDRPFADLIPVYRANFAKLNDIRYQIDLKNFTESANSREILIKGNYLLVYRLKGEDFKMSGGTIEMNLIKRNNGFRIERLDYRKGK
jgi:hypothetical protein